MKLIVKSHSNKEAARILGISNRTIDVYSNRTIDVYRAYVMEKMKPESLADLIVKAVKGGFSRNST